MPIMKQLRSNAKIAMLAIVAMVVPVFIQLAQALPAQTNANDAHAQYVVICTTAGFVYKKIEQGRSPLQSQNQNTNETENPNLTCPVCISFEIGSNSCVADPVNVSIRFYARTGLASWAIFQPLTLVDFNASLSRAPPVFQTI